MWWNPTGGPVWSWPIGGAQYGPEGEAQPAPVNDLVLLRKNLVGELQAIIQYEAHAARAADPRVRELLLHIARDEKEHVAELTRMINTLDPQQAKEFTRPPHA